MTCLLSQMQFLHDTHSEIDNLPHNYCSSRHAPDENESYVPDRQPIDRGIMDSLLGLSIEFQDAGVVSKEVHAPTASKISGQVEQSTDQEDTTVGEDEEAINPADVLVE